MSENPQYIRELLEKNTSLERGEVAPGRVRVVEQSPDGRVKRTEINPETHRKSCARAYAAKNWVAAVRHELNLSQSSFSSGLGLSIHTLRNWESEKTKPSGPAATLLMLVHDHPELFGVIEKTVSNAPAERIKKPVQAERVSA